MDNLSPDEVKFLCTLPPFLVDYDEIVIRHYGENPPQKAWDCLESFRDLQNNLDRIKLHRCAPQSEHHLSVEDCKLLTTNPPYVYDYDDIIIKYYGDNPSQKAWDFLEDFLDLKENFERVKCRRELESEQNIDENHSEEPVEDTSLKNDELSPVEEQSHSMEYRRVKKKN